MRIVLLQITVPDHVTDEQVLLMDLGLASDVRILTRPMVLAIGDPINGLNIVGPFDDAEVAMDSTERQHAEDWWLMDMDLPQLDPNLVKMPSGVVAPKHEPEF